MGTTRCPGRHGVLRLQLARGPDARLLPEPDGRDRVGNGSGGVGGVGGAAADPAHAAAGCRGAAGQPRTGRSGDRKSTRLNSSHVKISYAVFCLKKKMYIELLRQ